MQIKTGIDILKISRLEKVIERQGDAFVRRIFHDDEYNDRKLESLAGIYCAKESIIKALSLGPEKWLDINIYNDRDGKPQFKVKNSNHKILSSDISIAHDDDYAVASVVILTE